MTDGALVGDPSFRSTLLLRLGRWPCAHEEQVCRDNRLIMYNVRTPRQANTPRSRPRDPLRDCPPWPGRGGQGFRPSSPVHGRRAMEDCSGRVAIVTGESRGVGKAIAMRLAAEGASVCVTGRSAEPGSHDLHGSL